MEINWNPGEFLVPEFKSNYAVVVLNRPINGDKTLIEQLWRNCKITLISDQRLNSNVIIFCSLLSNCC